MNSRHLEAFEAADLDKYFDKYGTEKFVQRFLRRNGINTVGDLLVLDRVEFEEFLARANQVVRSRCFSLHELLCRHRDRILGAKRQTDETAVPPSAPDEAETGLPKTIITSDKGEDHEAALELKALPAQPALALGPCTPDASAVPPPMPSEPEHCLSHHKTREHSVIRSFPLGKVVRRDKFSGLASDGIQRLAFDESGLRRHVLIAGTTGSGKTVAARFIIEMAAIHRVPSLVIDAQGDLSSLVLQCAATDRRRIFETAEALLHPATSKERKDLDKKVDKHAEAIADHPEPIAELLAERCEPRIFTPGRPQVGLPLSLPPYLDVLSAWSDSSDGALTHEEIEDLLYDEIRNLIRTILPRAKPGVAEGYVELLSRLFKHAHRTKICLDGRDGIKRLHKLVEDSPKLEPDLFRNYLTERDCDGLMKAVYSLQFHQHAKWHEGHPLDVCVLVNETSDNRTPINILNVHELHNPEDKKRVLRQLIASVYKFGLQHPRQSGAPSMLLYIDEIGSGFGERSVGKAERNQKYEVYRVLNQLVRQARKYGVSVMLASQSYTDFSPNIRRQLGTKIIGKVDERGEQQRVAASIAEDLSQGGIESREVVERELPSLSPPRLLFINVRGETRTYEQLKCCTLDVVLTGEDVRRWREQYEQAVVDGLTAAKGDHEAGKHKSALAHIGRIETRAKFLPSRMDEADVLRCRALIGVGQVSEAASIYRDLAEQRNGLGWLTAGKELAAVYKDRSELDKYVEVLEVAVRIAKTTDREQYELLQLQLLKHGLFESQNLNAAAPWVSAISESADKSLSLFGRAWRTVVDHFREWRESWSFLGGGEEPATEFIQPADEPLTVIVTALPRSEHVATESTTYTSELATKPEILQISKIRTAGESERQSVAFSLAEAKAARSRQKRRMEVAQSQRATGQVAEAIRTLEAYLSEPPLGVLADHEDQQLASFDADPNIRRARVQQWLSRLDWRQFELETAQLFMSMGFNAWATKPSGDGGVDVRAMRNDETVIIQCKHWKKKVGLSPVQALSGQKEAEGAARAILVTSSTVEPGARKWAERHGVELLDGTKLITLFDEQSDSTRWRRDNRVAVPEEKRPVEPKGERSGSGPSVGSRLSDGEERILELARRSGQIRNRDVQQLLSISRPAAGNRLRKLVKLGYLKMHGTRAVAFYTPNSEVIDAPRTLSFD